MKQVTIGRHPGDCWEWIGPLNASGYGAFSFVVRSPIWMKWFDLDGPIYEQLAHRVAYIFFVEPIPDGMWVLHRCHNRCCVNPDHLYLGDSVENTIDCRRSGRAFHGPGQKVVLTEDEARIIRASKLGIDALAEKYRVNRSTIWNIKSRRLWKWLH